MAKRYIPNAPFSVQDKKGRRRVFNPDRKGPDGTLGYTEEEISDLYKDHIASFRVDSVTGEKVTEDVEVIEEATSAPGEKRTAKTKAAKK